MDAALPTLLDLSKKLRGSIDNPVQLRRFEDKENQLLVSIELIRNTLRTWSPTQTTEVTLSIFSKVFPALLNCLGAVSDLLRLQEENKVNAILHCAQTCLGFLKQIRDQSTSKVVQDNADLWFKELHRLAMQRVTVTSDLEMARKLEAGAQNGLQRWNQLLHQTNKSGDDIAYIARCIGDIVQVSQTFVDISSSFAVSSGDDMDLGNFVELLNSLPPAVQVCYHSTWLMGRLET